ncbi:MFS transporter [Helicobacter sp. MIT 21-1697]|uniref:MFS transporter n=1 Tax=Helicobacter sp. MIT 21-1697 TaxID=2993733 RepID=UPI00224ADA69|nr:MFS transporter [Helicobacter sp. MIT 21-1697]MCX2717164.1 MFS transporter [Helicobacter sp. MIT 21-1697]
MHEAPKNRFEEKIHILTHRPRFMFALFSSTSMTVFGSMIIATSIPAIEKYFVDIPHIQTLSKLILTLPALFIMLFSPLGGILIDKFGRLKFLISSMILWSVSGVLGALWDNIYWVLFTRAIFGIATAFVMTTASTLVADYYVGEERAKALGIQGFATACSSAIFMCIGGILAHFDWHYPFYVYGLGIFLSIFVASTLFEPRVSKRKQILKEAYKKINIMSILPCYFFGFIIMVAYYTSPTQIPHFIIQNLGKSEMIVGFCICASAFAYGVSSLFYPRIRQFLSLKGIYVVGFMCMGSGFALIFILHNIYAVVLGLLLVGTGGGAMIVNNSSLLLSLVPKQHIAKAIGVLSATACFGQFVSPLFSQPIVNRYGIVHLFLVVALLLFAMSAFALCKPK